MSRMMDSSRELENAFKQIITAGWAMKSDGHVEAPTGHFAMIPIAAFDELNELVEAVFEGEQVSIDPGYYFAKEDSNGNLWLWRFGSSYEMKAMYARYEREYNDWTKPTYYVVCRKCSEQFDSIQDAYEHGTSDPNTKAWCGEDGFDVTEGGVL